MKTKLLTSLSRENLRLCPKQYPADAECFGAAVSTAPGLASRRCITAPGKYRRPARPAHTTVENTKNPRPHQNGSSFHFSGFANAGGLLVDAECRAFFRLGLQPSAHFTAASIAEALRAKAFSLGSRQYSDNTLARRNMSGRMSSSSVVTSAHAQQVQKVEEKKATQASTQSLTEAEEQTLSLTFGDKMWMLRRLSLNF